MRATVEIIIRDEAGKIVSQRPAYGVDLGTQSLHDIEGAVEKFRQQGLPDLEADLLHQAQEQFTQQEKKRGTEV